MMTSDVCERPQGLVMTVVGSAALVAAVTVIGGTVFGWAILGLTAVIAN